MPRLNHRLGWAKGDFADFLDILAVTTELVEPAPPSQGSPSDAADLAILGTYLAARADYLVTGDRDLLALAKSYAIVTPAEFWRRHGGP